MSKSKKIDMIVVFESNIEKIMVGTFQMPGNHGFSPEAACGGKEDHSEPTSTALPLMMPPQSPKNKIGRRQAPFTLI